ncbi:hypothetical protein E2493_00820 [Sphingomonas parva]|uniref:Uncharacterized protein n=1 Tax=Sphingomonas parva TaxID=2555898 RepID=A0A4Y8ZXK4_9SPHN|nr:hypothetical protein [Sphingomonas parva]TFI60287.1 hypothetical protein E2493_00820 [Sphingomonas parva]
MKSIIALALVANATTAAAAEPPCVTDAEFKSMALFVLPSVVYGAADRCAAHLPSDAYLLNGARRMADGVARDRARHEPTAVAALARLSGTKLPKGVSGETLGSMLNDMLRAQLVTKVTPGDCSRIDEVASLLAPLPAENLVGLLGVLFREGMRRGKKPPFQICAAQEI